MSLFANLDGGPAYLWCSTEDLQAAGLVAWSPGCGWRVTRAGRRFIRRLLALYTREDAAHDLARLRRRRAAPDPKWARWRREREPVFGDRARAGR